MDDRAEMSDQAAADSEARQGDRRVQRTRAALRSAFNDLILARGYDAISAADIAERANVGRSTFYQHYQSKHDILAQSLAPVLAPLANGCSNSAPDPKITLVVEHFWQNRKLAKALMSGPARKVMARLLASSIEERLAANPCTRSAGEAAIPAPLLAIQLAHGQLALIEEWLSGRHGCSTAQIAAALQATSYAMATLPALRQ